MKFSPARALRAALTCAALSFATTVSAASIPVFSTGTDASGNVVANGTVGDAHYTMTSAPAGAVTTIKAGTSAGGYPIGPWIGDNSISRWIGPNTSQFFGPAGAYTFRTTFDMTGLDISTAVLTGRFAADDSVSGPILNGGSAATSVGWNSWRSFTINSGFLQGMNTLDFRVTNRGGPIGLRVEISGTADALTSVPVPASIPLVLSGLVALGWVARRRKA